ncbi:MAG: TIM barrel protein [Pelagimonas sp.]|jgi:hydroxypyruvate isomerase|nr:TIM barrel protein [Pelagimonas sp.]
MPRVAANISLLFPELPLLDRIARAAALGFDGVECLFPYELSAKEFAQALQAADLPLALINTPVADWAQGARGCAAIPGQEIRFQAEFAQAVAYARTCQAQIIHVMAGVFAGGADTFVSNLQWSADQAPDLTLTIEPLNPIDMPGYWLADFDRALEVLKSVDRPNVGLQFDLWHAQRIGDMGALWTQCAPWVRHVQFAGLATRGAPEAPDDALWRMLDRIQSEGYQGWLSAEYIGAKDDSADWLCHLDPR